MVLESLRQSFLTLYVLNLLYECGEMYGYQICKEAMQRDKRELKYGTLYPLLTSLEKSGLVEGIQRDSPRGPYRKYYRLTEKGKSIFREKQSMFAELGKSLGFTVIPRLDHGPSTI